MVSKAGPSDQTAPAPVYKPFWRRADADWFLTLLLSSAAIILTGGFSLVVSFGVVFVKGRRATIDSPPHAYKAVLGLKLDNGALCDDYRLRLNRAISLHNRHKSKTPIILLGGYTGGKISEAEAGSRYLTKRGMAKNEIIIEDSSTHSLENLREVRKILEAEGDALGVTLISNRYHLARLDAVAKGLSIDYSLCAAEDNFSWWKPQALGKMVIEAIFLHWYHTGKWFSTVTRNRRILDQIT